MATSWYPADMREMILLGAFLLHFGASSALAHDAPHVQPEPAPAAGAGANPQEFQQGQQPGTAQQRGGSCASCSTVGSSGSTGWGWLALLGFVGWGTRALVRRARGAEGG